MCQQMVSGVSFDTGNFVVASETATPCMKSLFYGLLETYFAVYDSVVLTGPISGALYKNTLFELCIVRCHTPKRPSKPLHEPDQADDGERHRRHAYEAGLPGTVAQPG
jgi:hypothetical protein